MNLEDAIACLKANGYRVTKPPAKKARPTLNALGKPISPQFDPNYRMRTPLTSISRLYAPSGRSPVVTSQLYWKLMEAKNARD
jgi:hypothetical protein